MRITWEARVPTRWPEHRGDTVTEDQHHTDLETMDGGRYARIYVSQPVSIDDAVAVGDKPAFAVFSDRDEADHATLRAIQGRRLRITMETIDD